MTHFFFLFLFIFVIIVFVYSSSSFFPLYSNCRIYFIGKYHIILLLNLLIMASSLSTCF